MSMEDLAIIGLQNDALHRMATIQAAQLSNERGHNARAEATLKFYKTVDKEWEAWCMSKPFDEVSR